MPGRKIPLVTNEIYHVFNRGIDHKPTFFDKKDFLRATDLINYYRSAIRPTRFSFFSRLNEDIKINFINQLKNKDTLLVDFIAYNLMPNHIHFLVRQLKDQGISNFMSNFQNSLTRYSNTKINRVGPIFLDQFKAVRIETDEQLLHVSRYIHLNPYSSFVVKDIKELKMYQWSSLPEYLEDIDGICNKDLILSFFKNKNSFENYIFDQADYQRSLQKIKHVALDVD